MELERQLDAAQRAQQGEADRRCELEVQALWLRGRLKDAAAKQAGVSRQLW